MHSLGREKGHISFTPDGYTSFVRAFRKHYSDNVTDTLARVERLHEQLAALSGPNVDEERLGAFNYSVTRTGFVTERQKLSRAITSTFNVGEDIMSLIKDEMFRGAYGALTKPRAIMFPTCDHDEANFSVNCGNYGTLTFTGDRVEWNVPPCVDSFTCVRKNIAYHAFDRALSEHHWQHGEGGYFQRLEEHEHGPYNDWQTLAYFGPEGDKLKQAEQDAIQSRIRAMRID